MGCSSLVDGYSFLVSLADLLRAKTLKQHTREDPVTTVADLKAAHLGRPSYCSLLHIIFVMTLIVIRFNDSDREFDH